LVEIIGPTGVGKTTISRNLLQMWDGNGAWISYEKLLNECNYSTFPLNQTDISAGLRFLQLFPEYLSQFKALNNGLNNEESWFINRKRELQHFKVLCDIQLISELYSTQKIKFPLCIYDEGITFKTFNRVDTDRHHLAVNQLLHTFPLPGVIVLIDAPADIIAERAFEREKTAPVHRHKNLNEIHENIIAQKKRFSNLVEILDKAGIIVYKLDSIDTPENSALKISELLNVHKTMLP